MKDLERGQRSSENQSKYDDGFAAVAKSISADPDNESFVFRAFRELGARRLLLQECELLHLEQQQKDLDEEVARSEDRQLHLSMRDWKKFSENANRRDEEKRRKELANEIDAKLEKYYRALLLQRKLAKLERPSVSALLASRIALHGETGDDFGLESKLGGEAKYMFDDEVDLVALNPSLDHDLLSKFLRNHWIGKIRKSSLESRIAYFENHSLAWVVRLCSIAIAALLLIGPILALYFITDPDTRLALVIVFIALFALGLHLSTGASRDSIFGGTAAYAAVLVVFVSGNLGNAKIKQSGP